MAGFTTVSAQVLDPHGFVYANGTWTANFVDPGTPGKTPLINNSIITRVYAGDLDSFGNFTVNLPDNAVIASQTGCVNTQWTFTFAAKSTPVGLGAPPAFSVGPLTITGTAQNITSTVQAAAASLVGVSGAIAPSAVNGVQFVDGVNNLTIAQALSNLPGGIGTIWVTASAPSQTITTSLNLTNTCLKIDPGVTVFIGTGGSITVGTSGCIDAAGATISYTSSANGDAIRCISSLGVVRVGFLLWQGTGTSANGLVFIGSGGPPNQSQFNQAYCGIIKNFPGNNIQFGRSGVGGAINNLVIVQQIVGGGTGVFFPSGVSGTDTAAFDEGNMVICSLCIAWTTAGVKFGDGGSLADALFNKYYGDVHDQTAGGTIPVSFTDATNNFSGNLFSDHGGPSLCTFSATAINNYVTVPDQGIGAFTGAGLANNIVTSQAVFTAPNIQSPAYISQNGAITFNNASATGQAKFDLEGGTSVVLRNLVTGGDRFYFSAIPPEGLSLFGGANNTSAAQFVLQKGSIQAPNIVNTSLTSASNGNSVTLLNAQANAAAVTGTGSAVTLYTYSLLANTVATLKAIRITTGVNHSTGSGTVNYSITLNGQTLANFNSSSTQGGYVRSTVINTASTTGTQFSDGMIQGTGLSNAGSLASLAWTSNQTINMTFNAANTEAVTPLGFMVELIQ